jgi:hypothetical protein
MFLNEDALSQMLQKFSLEVVKLIIDVFFELVVGHFFVDLGSPFKSVAMVIAK